MYALFQSIIWKEPTDHNSNCFFCLTPPIGKGLSRKKKQNIQYPDIPSVIRPVPHGETLPALEAPQKFTLDSDDEQNVSSMSSDGFSMSQKSYFAQSISHELHLITQSTLHNLIRDLELSKIKAELLASRFQQWNVLADDVRKSKYRN